MTLKPSGLHLWTHFKPTIITLVPSRVSASRLSASHSSTEGAMNAAVGLFSDPDLWLDESLLFNGTAANSTSTYSSIISPMMNKTICTIMIVVLTITMVSLGCSMEVSKIKVKYITYVYEEDCII